MQVSNEMTCWKRRMSPGMNFLRSICRALKQFYEFERLASTSILGTPEWITKVPELAGDVRLKTWGKRRRRETGPRLVRKIPRDG